MSEKIVKYDLDVVKEVKACLIINNINGQLIRRRYRLDVSLRNGNKDKIALFIMMNPSKADAEVADDTIKKITTYISKKKQDIKVLCDIGKIIFVNLYVTYETKSGNINEWIKSYGIEFVKGTETGAILNNDIVIKEAIETADIYFAAWGEADILDYKERIIQINKLLKDKEVFCIGTPTQNGFPRHLSRIHYSWDVKNFI